MNDIQQSDIGRKVLYCGRVIEEGVITSFNSAYVFVRFGNDVTPKACRLIDLELTNADDL